MKIYAKQVPPEYQESPLFWDESAFENIEIFGNNNFNRHTSALFDRLEDILSDLLYEWEEMQAGRKWYRAYETWAEALAGIATPEGRPEYTREERRDAWPRLLENYRDSSNITAGLLCRTLELITGRTWDYCTLRGCCQGDWQDCIYPADEWDADSLERLEAEYFNTGSEWIIHDDGTEPDGPEDINGFSLYCTGWNDDLIRQEIADSAGGSPADVTLYKFTGYTRRAEYEEC